MKKSLLLLLALTLASLCLNCVNSVAQRKGHRGFSINTGRDKTITDCGQITMRVDDLQVVRSEQERALPRSAVSSLQVQAALHGGIQVSGGDRDQYAIKACLGAAGESGEEAQRLLAQLALSVQDGRVTVTGPGGDSWMGYLIIQAPNGTAMELEAENSPIGVSSITANIEARNQNGPLTLRDVNGQVRADVQNGPITVSGNRGEHRLKAENGPLTVELTGSRWESGELEGSTQNGPIVLSLPPDYQSAVRVDTSKHSPVVCRAAQCKESVRTWDRPHLIEFGGPNPVIRLSTVNGPTTVTSSGDK